MTADLYPAGERRDTPDALRLYESYTIPPHLETQLADFLNIFEEGKISRIPFKPESAGVKERERNFLERFLNQVLKERTFRADQLEEEDFGIAQTIGLKWFSGIETFSIECVDERIKPPIKHGLLVGMVHTMALPAGKTREFRFLRTDDGREVAWLPDDSKLAQEHDKAFATKGVVVQVLDSHVGCAAQASDLGPANTGEELNDGGLLIDVLTKKQKARALEDYARRTGKAGNLIVIQESYDPGHAPAEGTPHGGYLYQGLETEAALAYATSKGGFTNEVLNLLAKEKKIISTEQLAAEFEDEFSKYLFDTDWKIAYANTARKYWEIFDSFAENLLPRVKEKIVTVYGSENMGETELHHRAMLLLTNAYSGFLENSKPGGNPNTVHNAPLGAIESGKYGPHETPAFVVSTTDPDKLNHILFVAQLIRGIRQSEGTVDTTGIYKGNGEFKRAAVPFFYKFEVSENLNPVDLANLTIQELDDLAPDGWYDMTDDEYRTHLLNNYPSFSKELMHDLVEMRGRMKELYDPSHQLQESLRYGDICIVPLMVDGNRRPLAIPPFSFRNAFKPISGGAYKEA